LVLQQETQDSQEKREKQKKRPWHQTIKLGHEHSKLSLEYVWPIIGWLR
jgi:hypothetical protein